MCTLFNAYGSGENAHYSLVNESEPHICYLGVCHPPNICPYYFILRFARIPTRTEYDKKRRVGISCVYGIEN